MTVPSSTRCSGPAALIGGVWSGVRRCSDEGDDGGRGDVACCGNWAAEFEVRPAVRLVALHNRIGDLVHRRARAICPCRRIGLRRVPTNVRALVLRPPAQNDVAGKEALVLAPLSICRDRILRRRRLRVVVLAPAGRSAPARPVEHLASLARRAGAAGPDSHERGRRSEPARAPSVVAGRAGGSGRPTMSMIASMPTATPAITHVCTPRGRTPRGTGRWSATVAVGGSRSMLAAGGVSAIPHRPCCKKSKRSLPSAK